MFPTDVQGKLIFKFKDVKGAFDYVDKAIKDNQNTKLTLEDVKDGVTVSFSIIEKIKNAIKDVVNGWESESLENNEASFLKAWRVYLEQDLELPDASVTLFRCAIKLLKDQPDLPNKDWTSESLARLKKALNDFVGTEDLSSCNRSHKAFIQQSISSMFLLELTEFAGHANLNEFSSKCFAPEVKKWKVGDNHLEYMFGMPKGGKTAALEKALQIKASEGADNEKDEKIQKAIKDLQNESTSERKGFDLNNWIVHLYCKSSDYPEDIAIKLFCQVFRIIHYIDKDDKELNEMYRFETEKRAALTTEVEKFIEDKASDDPGFIVKAINKMKGLAKEKFFREPVIAEWNKKLKKAGEADLEEEAIKGLQEHRIEMNFFGQESAHQLKDIITSEFDREKKVEELEVALLGKIGKKVKDIQLRPIYKYFQTSEFKQEDRPVVLLMKALSSILEKLKLEDRTKNRAAEKIQRCWKEYKAAVTMEKWRIVIDLESKKAAREARVQETIDIRAAKLEKEERTKTKKAAEKAARTVGYVKQKLTKEEKEVIVMQSWKPHDDALMVALHYKYGLPQSYSNSDKIMKYYRDKWEMKEAKAIWKRLDMLYRADALEDIGAIIDLLTPEEQAEYCPGFGTSKALAHKNDWGRTETDFDYANMKTGGKFMQSNQKVASQVNKYEGVDDEEWQEEVNEDGVAKAQPVAKVKIG